jgi:flagellar assembly protein FliH
MPLSPEASVAVAAAPWQPEDLDALARSSTGAAVSAVAAVGAIGAAGVGRPGLPVFELASAAAVPPAVLEPARRAAEAAGYAAGWATGMQEARAAVEDETRELRGEASRAARADRDRIDRAIGSLAAATAEMTARTAPMLDEVEALIVEGAYRIAEALVGAALREDETRGAAAVRRALTGLPTDVPVSIRVNPGDREILLARGGAPSANVMLVSDPSIASGDAIATCGATTVDARISAGLERVRNLLEGAS